jgi:hypothetical protein
MNEDFFSIQKVTKLHGVFHTTVRRWMDRAFAVLVGPHSLELTQTIDISRGGLGLRCVAIEERSNGII